MLRSLAALLLFAVATACSSDDSPKQTGRNVLTLKISMPAADVTGRAGGYEDGSYWENYLDIENNNYRILFFDDSNRFLTMWTPANAVKSASENRTLYTMEGIFPEQVNPTKGFKVMVLANWPEYPDFYPGVLIDDVVRSSYSMFNLATATDNNGRTVSVRPDASNLMPFYGICHYNGVSMKDNAVTLPGQIAMLRALAKIEVTYIRQDIEPLDGVAIKNYNCTGYCAPRYVYHQNDYVHNDWNSDWVHNINIPGDENDWQQRSLEMIQLPAEGNTQRFVAYVPEYDNSAAASMFSSLEFRSPTPENNGTLEYKSVYFSNSPLEFNRYAFYNIERNNIYRFTITARRQTWPMEVTAEVHDWTYLYYNVSGDDWDKGW